MGRIDIRASDEVSALLREERQRQVHRVLQSVTFRNASMLQQLLQFLTARVFDGSAESLKEYTIGVEALSRPHDFDPKTDTIVRVQIHRLRQKLKDYYDSEGRHDPIVIEIPKGHYLPTFEVLGTTGAEAGHHFSVEQERSAFSSPQWFGPDARDRDEPTRLKNLPIAEHTFTRAMVAVAAALVLFAAGFWIGNKRPHNADKDETVSNGAKLNLGKSADPVKVFWANFLGNDSAPIIVYPDAVFLLDDSNDLFRFRRGASDDRGAVVDPHLARQFASNPSLVSKAGQLYYENGYTGSGELKGIAMLANMFGQMGVKATIEPSRDLTTDDLKQHNVIMLGSPFQNVAVAQLTTNGEFIFDNPDSRREQWRAVIINAHPRANEAATYHTERDPTTRALKMDYALISIQPGVIPGRYIATLGGLDTTGTEGAVMFATSKPGIEELARDLPTSGGYGAAADRPVFQALLNVRLQKGYEVLNASLVSVHVLPSPNAPPKVSAVAHPVAQ